MLQYAALWEERNVYAIQLARGAGVRQYYETIIWCEL